MFSGNYYLFISLDFYITIDYIYKLANQSIELYENHIHGLPLGEGQYEIRRYKIRNFGLWFSTNDYFVFGENEEELYNYHYDKENAHLCNYCQLIIEYIDNFRGQSKEKELKIKTPKLFDESKPVLNQNQISLLFIVFKDKKTFTNRDIDKTDLSKILSKLSGYEPESFRQNLSKEFKVISDKKTDYEIIISKLTEVINELKRQIK